MTFSNGYPSLALLRANDPFGSKRGGSGVEAEVGGGGGGQGKPGHTYVIHSHDYAREGCQYYKGRTDRFQRLLLHAFVSTPR